MSKDNPKNDLAKKLMLQLARYLPERLGEICVHWIIEHKIKLTITPKRSSKFGDYRAPYKRRGHEITVNGDLNPFAFFIVFTHEVAHLITWEMFKHQVKPHGKEWQEVYRRLLAPFATENYFPKALLPALRTSLKSAPAGGCTDLNLYRALKKYDKTQTTVLLENLPAGSIFYLENGRKFLKGEQLRKRFRCKELPSNKIYLFSPVAEVIPAD